MIKYFSTIIIASIIYNFLSQAIAMYEVKMGGILIASSVILLYFVFRKWALKYYNTELKYIATLFWINIVLGLNSTMVISSAEESVVAGKEINYTYILGNAWLKQGAGILLWFFLGFWLYLKYYKPKRENYSSIDSN